MKAELQKSPSKRFRKSELDSFSNGQRSVRNATSSHKNALAGTHTKNSFSSFVLQTHLQRDFLENEQIVSGSEQPLFEELSPSQLAVQPEKKPLPESAISFSGHDAFHTTKVASSLQEDDILSKVSNGEYTGNFRGVMQSNERFTRLSEAVL